MEASTDDEPQSQPEPSAAAAEAAEEHQEQQEEDENEVLMAKAQSLMDNITANPENPSPNVLHALSTILETQESRISWHENDEFFELISSKFLTEGRYSVSVQAATTRLLVSCSLTWTYPHVFEDDVLANIRGWVMEEIPRSSGEEHNWKHDMGKRKTSDSDMLRTYSTGLLAVCLACGGQLVEDVLTSGLSAKLMRYLRVRVLGDTNIQKDGNPLIDNKGASNMACPKAKEEGRGRLRQVTETSHVDVDTLRIHPTEKDRDRDPASLDDPDRDHERGVSRQSRGDECWGDEEPPDNMVLEVDADEAEADGEEKCNIRDFRESKTKTYGKSHREEDIDINVRDDSSRRRTNRGFPRSRGKGRSSEGVSENEQALTSPGSGSRSVQARSVKDRRNLDSRRVSDAKKGLGRNGIDYFIPERDDNDDCFQEFKVGSKDISDLVKRAVRAAEAEARAANAPILAVRAAGDDAAEVVKTAALEEYSKTNDEEAAVIAASKAASTVVDAANAVALSRNSSNVDSDSGNSKLTEPEINEDIANFPFRTATPLRSYGRNSVSSVFFKHKETSNTVVLLSDILKLICALAAHRKFAALFVDRGGDNGACLCPSLNVVHQVVELALQLLACPLDHQARKNAALFFAAAFVFRAVIDTFDEQDGLQKLLSLLHDAASIAYHTCVALRQYFRAHLLLVVDSIRPTKNIRSAPRNISRAGYKPLDISNEAMDAVFRQIQKDRKLGPALAARWPVVDKFLGSNGHITMLELCQAPPVERYLHDLLQYALGILHIVTLVPYSRKPIVNATLSNDRVGIAVILDAANGAGYVEPEIVEPALNLLINLVCPPPSISNKPSPNMQGQNASSTQTGNGPAMESRDRNTERNIPERAANVPSQNEPREREPTSVDRGSSSVVTSSSQASGLVGDRRISLGAGAGCAGLAAQLEQGYRQAREAVRANNGIKVLLQLLQPRMVTSPAALDCLRALTCRVLLGLARDDTIAHILTKLQVGKKLSELIRDSGSQTPGGEQNRWQTELAQVAIELIGVVTNSGRASTLAASDAATPTLRRIERAAIAAATPISYHSRELLLLIHEHLQASGLAESAGALLKEAKLTPLPSLAAPSSLAHQASERQEVSSVQIQWPSGRAPSGFLSDKSKGSLHQDDSSLRCDLAFLSSKKKPLSSSESPLPSNSKTNVSSLKVSVAADVSGTPSVSASKSGGDVDFQTRTPIVLPLKRKLTDLKDNGLVSSAKRLNTGEHIFRSPGFTTPNTVRRSGLQSDAHLFFSPSSTPKDHQSRLVPNIRSSDIDENQIITSQTTSSQPGLLSDPQPSGSERLTLDSLVVQYLKHQHRQCPAPITTLPPLSLLHPHVCPEPKRSLDAPSTPWRTCRDDTSALLTCVAFLGDSSRVAAGGHTGELKVFDSNSNNVLESCTSHQSPLTLLQSHFSGENQLILSSSAMDVRLWDASSVSGGPKHSFDGIKAARFSNSGAMFASLQADSPRREILLYDIHTCQLDLTLTDASNNLSGRGHAYSHVHFSPSDSMLLWNGVLWDRRGSGPIHRFDQFTDYGGGGFHPAGNEVIINSEVWDLRNFRLLRSVPSLDQTVITFNASGDVIYAILRRNLEDVTSAFNTRRVKHPLFSAFRTVDAVNYSDIATIPVDRCVLDFATEPTDSFVGLVTMDDQDEMYSSARVYEIGRRKPTDDDSDPDDAESEEEEDDEGDDDSIMEGDLDGDGDSDDADDMSNDDSVSGFDDDEEDDGDFIIDDVDFDGDGILEIVTEGDEDDDDEVFESYSSGDEDDLL
ncbi:hypothetical protein DH2020_005960 [Rehmannia glutinosa]|uniref:LisH domain-containing protein n=1 Tax=Rehmannia glutinosa TaxID=99300 RepID=A0ABR0XHL7_REHGL